MKKEKEMLIPKGWIPTRVVSVLLLSAVCIGQGIAQGGSYADSPFGMHTAWTRPYLRPEDKPDFKFMDYSDALSIGVKWERPALYTSYPFTIELMDRIYKDIPQGINIVANIETPRERGTFKLRISEKEYIDFVKQVIERYDGDGKDDMPNLKNPIKYWQIDNEPPFWQFGFVDGLPPVNLIGWLRDSRNDYAHILELADSAIKSACPNCKTVIGGMVGESPDKMPIIFKEFYEPIIDKLNGSHIDIFDFHIFGDAKGDYKNSKAIYEMIRQGLNKYDYKNTEIWNIESGTYSGQPFEGGGVLTKQSEKDQATDLVKRFIYPLTFGAKKVFWAWAMVEGVNPIDNNDYFDNTGLIFDGIGKDDPGYSVKKLSYYTYKKMVEILEGSDWNNIQTVQGSDNVYIYKLTKNGKPIWVAWNDSSDTRTITISGITSGRVKATDAVPKYESGKDVIDYAKAFQTDTLVVTNGAVALTLGQRPMFVEPLTLTSVEDDHENIPKEFALQQNYPNPFNPTTNIRFTVPQRSHVTLKVFDVLGKEVATLVNEEKEPGTYTVSFDTRHSSIVTLSSGVYFYRLSTGGFIETKKMLITK